MWGFFSEFSKKWNTCERTLSGVYVYKILTRYCKKWPSLVFWRSKTAIFTLFPAISAFYDFFLFARFWPFKGCSRDIARVLDEKLTQKHVSRRQNPKFSVWPFLNLLTLNDLDLEYTHRKLRMILRSVPDTIHVTVLAYFHSVRI